jgi:hypothetical protein
LYAVLATLALTLIPLYWERFLGPAADPVVGVLMSMSIE